MEPLPVEIVEHYEGVREEDRISDGFGRLELLRVQEVLRRHLPAAPADVLDVGGGTGIHAEWLARDGYRVRLLDASPRHVRHAAAVLEGLGATAELGDARKLSDPDASQDVVLLFGPLYHLVDRDDRLRALREAARVVRPGGLVAVAAVNRFASLFDGLARGLLFEPGFREVVEEDLRSGQHRNPDDRPQWWTTAYFHRPEELREEVAEAGLLVRDLVGVEGLAGYLPDLSARWQDPQDREQILWSARVAESVPALSGLSAHLVLVAGAPE